MNEEESYYYFISGADHNLDEFRKIQPLQPQPFWKDIYYYPFQRSQNFFKLIDLFNRNNDYQLDIQYIQKEIIKASNDLYFFTNIIPNMQLQNIYIQYDIKRPKSQICVNYQQKSKVVFVEATNSKSFQETLDEFKKQFDEFICSYSQFKYNQNYKNQKYKSTEIDYFQQLKENWYKKTQKQQQKQKQTYLIRNLQNYIRFQSNQINFDKIQTYMEIINNQYINWIEFDLNFLIINNIEKIMQQSNAIYILSQLQQYCIVIDAINQYYDTYREIVLYVTQVKSYLKLQDQIIDIVNLSVYLMNFFIVPQLKNKNIQPFKQIVKYKEKEIKEQIYEYISKKINDL